MPRTWGADGQRRTILGTRSKWFPITLTEMPPPRAWGNLEGAFTTGHVPIRLLGDRYGIEKITKTWERVVVDKRARVRGWAEVVQAGLSGKADLPVSRIVAFCATALKFIDWSIAANRREDGLFHTYNRLEFEDDGQGVKILRLPQMLEGQVAVLSSGYLEPEAAISVLRKLFESPLYDPGRRSFLLYPAVELPSFLERNTIAPDRVERNLNRYLELRREIAGRADTVTVRGEVMVRGGEFVGEHGHGRMLEREPTH